MSRMLRWILIGVVVVLVAALGLYWYAVYGRATGAGGVLVERAPGRHKFAAVAVDAGVCRHQKAQVRK